MKPSNESINKFLKDFGHDGWSILLPNALETEYGFPAGWAKPLVRKHVSGEGKYAITSNEGKAVKTLKGIHTLSVLSKLAGELGAECASKLGRGSQAAAYTEGIRKVLES